jgi:hypothetical protein
MSEAKKIFIRGLSRSGGTLIVTLLDAHPDVAMSYELYGNLLDPKGDDFVEPRKVYEWMESQGSRLKMEKVSKLDHRGLRTFISRIVRGGLDLNDFKTLLKQHIDANLGFDNPMDRLTFIESCALVKMDREGKHHWGMKCSNRIVEYLERWPDAYFVNVIRDGRDVLASQMKTGSFKKTPTELAEGWVSTHTKFRKMMGDSNINTYELFYERMVHEPESETKSLCEFLGLTFDASMLDFYKKDLTIFKANHLSMDRISSPIDASKIGRWKKDLSDQQIKEFEATAGTVMKEFGYTEEGYSAH